MPNSFAMMGGVVALDRILIDMNVLICHERFLFRFGADRVLMLLGQGLQAHGCNITMMANRYDRDVLEQFASTIIAVPDRGAAYLDLNEYTAKWLREHWAEHFLGASQPDIIIVGGWPFLAAVPFFREVCANVVFFDQGVVPIEGYPQDVCVILEKLHKLRREYLPQCSMILANSEFTIQSQSLIESGKRVPAHSVLLGANHFENSLWSSRYLNLERARGNAIQRVRSLKRNGKKVILNLGRWEPGCYKNSQAAFSVIRALAPIKPESALVVLEEHDKLGVPRDLEGRVLGLGFPDDNELMEVMQESDLGVCVSRWEGFNLPLAEMQWLRRPALVFNLGAHPEVVAHPWYLCSDEADMVAKAGALLREAGPDPDEVMTALDRFQSYFRWTRFTTECWNVLRKMAISQPDESVLIVDVTNSTRDPANSGVIRVTRRLCRSIQRYRDPVFVVWDELGSRYVLPTALEHAQLSQFNGPVITDQGRLSPDVEGRIPLDDYLDRNRLVGGWLLLPELKAENSFRTIREYARRSRLGLAAIFYDAIALLRPELCNEEIQANHRFYMQGLADCDVVLPISIFSSACLTDFWKERGISPGARVIPNLLPGEFGGALRDEANFAPSGKAQILCVSTLEPRKNHRTLIEACLLLEHQHPDLDWSLKLVGNRYAGALDIAEYVEQTAAENARIQWVGIVDDTTLHRLYAEASFTVYASEIEGFGLPIVESIWHGKPCICFCEGVMAELAAEGGCLTTDVRNAEALAETIYHLATDSQLQLRLASEARVRVVKTWDDYAQDFLSALPRQYIDLQTTAEPYEAVAPDQGDWASWTEALYAGCLVDRWQMQDSERLAMAALLARTRPTCSVEVGTYCGGSLSLISQYSRGVFSIDVDPTVAERFHHFRNVSFLTGDSGIILPLLLQELDRCDVAMEFLLIDGDHTALGVQRDLNGVLEYVPRKPLFVMVHDSFNPDCRYGLASAEWAKSPYCHFVDLDFVPGRVVEHGGPTSGQMWGGLAFAYFAPAKRYGQLGIHQSARTLFELAQQARNGLES